MFVPPESANNQQKTFKNWRVPPLKFHPYLGAGIGLTSFMEDLLYYSCCSELQLSHFLAKFMPACKTDISFESLKT